MIKKLKEIKEFDKKRLYRLYHLCDITIENLLKLFPYYTQEEINSIVNNNDYRDFLNLENEFNIKGYDLSLLYKYKELKIFRVLDYISNSELLKIFNIYNICNNRYYQFINLDNLNDYKRDNYFNKQKNIRKNLTKEKIDKIIYHKKVLKLSNIEISNKLNIASQTVSKIMKKYCKKEIKLKEIEFYKLFKMIDENKSFEEIISIFNIDKETYEKIKNKEIYKDYITYYYKYKKIFSK